MIRGLGAVLVLGGCGFLGWILGQRASQRTALLRQLTRALEQLRREVGFHLTPLPELLERLAEGEGGTVGTFFHRCAQGAASPEEGISVAWRTAVEDLTPDIGAEAARCMDRLGQALGRWDALREGELLTAAVEELDSLRERSEQTARQEGRLYRSLGITLGALVVILLI